MGGTQTTPNVNQQTIPMFSPDGMLGDVPVANINQARQLGAKPAVSFQSPDGKPGWIPADKLHDAIAAGGKMLPLEQQETQHSGFWNAVKDDAVGALKSLPSMLPPVKAYQDVQHAISDYQTLKATGKTQEQQEDEARQAAGHGLAYRAVVPGVAQAVGVNLPAMEESAEQGDVGGVLGHTVVPAATAAAPLAAEGALRAVTSIPKSAVAKTARFASDIVDPEITGIVSPRLAHVQRALGRAADVLEKPATEAVPNTAQTYRDATLDQRNVPEFAGEEIEPPASEAAPVKPVAKTAPTYRDATVNKRNIPEYAGEEQDEIEPPATEAAPVTPETKAAASSPSSAAAARPAAADLEKQLNDALGGKPLQPGVALKNQPAAAKLPEGFTPVKSSVLKGYKYDPAAQEFDGITNSGQIYRHSQVTPEQFQAFEKSESKGAAWNDLRNGPGVTPLGKVDINGKLQPRIKPRSVEVNPETAQPEFSDVLAAKKSPAQTTEQPAAPAPEATQPKAAAAAASGGTENLTSLLEQSLDQVKPAKGGVMTSAAPADLAKRWGVDKESLSSGREQTRGMTPQQTEDYINKLAESYKKGRAVEPVMETRDADNNIISVDGRARAIAAQRAGIERIPIMIRRMPKVAAKVSTQ